VANEDLGVKRDCPNCSARFYDLQKDPAECPKCGHEFTPDVLLKSRKRLREEEQAAAKPSAKVDDDAEELVEDNVKEVDEDDEATSLADADEEVAPVKSKRVAPLDGEDADEDDDEDEDDDLAKIDDIDLPDDEEDETLLDDDDDADDLGGIATKTSGDDDR
jgi:uncharacterized protein (TIGR02300 family)